MSKKIAFCFLIYSKIDHIELWTEWFNNIDTAKYNIYIHYREYASLEGFERYRMPTCIETKYADISLVHAQNKMLQYAFEHDSDNYKFVLLSQSCIPLKSFQHVYDFLTKDHYGYLNICPAKQCFPNCKSLLEHLPEKYISKSHQWSIYNRLLVEKLAYTDYNLIQNLFKTVYAPEEVFYYTFIKIYGLEDQIKTTSNSSERATTFTNWEGTPYKYMSTRGIKTYLDIELEEILFLLRSPCLFGRKFHRFCSIQNSFPNTFLTVFLQDYFALG
jgi:hypothetical protein